MLCAFDFRMLLTRLHDNRVVATCMLDCWTSEGA